MTPRIQAIPAGQAVADRLFAENWKLLSEGDWASQVMPALRWINFPWFDFIQVGSGLRQLLRPENEADLEEAHHTCANGLLVSQSTTLKLLEVTGRRLIQDAIEPLEQIGQSSR